MSTDDLIPVPHGAGWLLILSCGHVMPWDADPGKLSGRLFGWTTHCQQCDLKVVTVTGCWRNPHA